MTEADFRTALAEVLDELPDDFFAMLERDNVSIVYRDWPTLEEVDQCGCLPAAFYLRTGALPNSQIGLQLNAAPIIAVFHGPLEAALCRHDDGMMRAEIRRVLVHEIAHHWSIPHERMKELGYA